LIYARSDIVVQNNVNVLTNDPPSEKNRLCINQYLLVAD
jgi:hypothetical protein